MPISDDYVVYQDFAAAKIQGIVRGFNVRVWIVKLREKTIVV